MRREGDGGLSLSPVAEAIARPARPYDGMEPRAWSAPHTRGAHAAHVEDSSLDVEKMYFEARRV